MKFNRKYLLTILFCLIYMTLSISGALPSALIATDQTNDVEKINWSDFLNYEYAQGDFKDEIDIVSVDIEVLANDVKLSVTFQGPPVLDATHLYWIWISFISEGGEDSGAGAWFHTGGLSGIAESYWMVAKNTTDISNLGTGTDDPTIVSNTMSWTTNSSYWDDVSNSNNWDVGVWAWTSDNSTYLESLMSGFSYWDYYPDDDSSWGDDSESTSTTTTTDEGNGENTSGFELYLSLTSLAAVPVVLRRRNR